MKMTVKTVKTVKAVKTANESEDSKKRDQIKQMVSNLETAFARLTQYIEVIETKQQSLMKREKAENANVPLRKTELCTNKYQRIFHGDSNSSNNCAAIECKMAQRLREIWDSRLMEQ